MAARWGAYGEAIRRDAAERFGLDLNDFELEVLMTVWPTVAEGNRRHAARNGGWSDGPDYTGAAHAAGALSAILTDGRGTLALDKED